MQFPNGVNKSNLIKLGVLGAAMYLLNNRNKSPAKISHTSTTPNKGQKTANHPLEQDNKASDNQAKMTPFTLGKQLANKFLGKKV